MSYPPAWPSPPAPAHRRSPLPDPGHAFHCISIRFGADGVVALLPTVVESTPNASENRFPSTVVPLARRVNPRAVHCIHSSRLLTPTKWHIRLPKPCRTNAHRVDFSPAFAREVWHGPYRSLWPDSGSM